MSDIDRLIEKAKETRLLNPMDRECSPDVYVDPELALLAFEVERLRKCCNRYRDDYQSLQEAAEELLAKVDRLRSTIEYVLPYIPDHIPRSGLRSVLEETE